MNLISLLSQILGDYKQMGKTLHLLTFLINKHMYIGIALLGEHMFYRNCPQCNEQIKYTNKNNRNRSEKLNKLCKRCAVNNWNGLSYLEKFEMKGDRKVYIRNCPSCKIDIKTINRRKYLDAIRNNIQCRSCGAKKRYGLDLLPNIEFINGNRLFFRICPSCNAKVYHKYQTHVTQAIKRKVTCVTCMIQRLKFIFPNYNPIACKLIDEYGKTHGYNFQHALNGGEFLVPTTKYFVDGYDKENNIVVEVDEQHHKYQIEADIHRQEKIISILGCKFIRLRIDEYYKSS